MRYQLLRLLCLLLLTISTFGTGISGCGNGGSSSDAIEVNTLDGRTNIPVGSSFLYRFAGSVDISSVTAENYFILPTPAPLAQVAKAAYDEEVCESAQALTALISCSVFIGCTLEPNQNLLVDTRYTICLAPSIRYASGAPFEGFMATFTTPSVTSYTVTYDGNGNTGGTAPTDMTNYEAGQTVTVLDNTGALVKTGNTFTGWNTLADGSGTTYTVGQTFPMGLANVTLYAKWTTNPTYTVTYDGNGNTGGTAPTDATHYEAGQTVTVLGNTGTLVKTGKSFAGWNTLADGSGTTYTAGQTFAMGSTNVTLYAKWTTQMLAIGGSVSGLTGTVVLQNNGGNDKSITTNGAYTFATAIPYNTDYAVTVLTQPAGQLCSVSNATGTATATVSNVDVACITPKKIFVTAAEHNGDFDSGSGAIVGADAFCMADASYPGSGTYKAFIVDGVNRIACTTANCGTGIGEHTDWVLAANTTYTRIDETTVIGTTNAVGIFTFPLTNSFVSAAGTRAWMGLDAIWTVAFSTCNNWTTSGVNEGSYGRADLTTNSSIFTGSQSCGNGSPIACVEQ